MWQRMSVGCSALGAARSAAGALGFARAPRALRTGGAVAGLVVLRAVGLPLVGAVLALAAVSARHAALLLTLPVAALVVVLFRHEVVLAIGSAAGATRAKSRVPSLPRKAGLVPLDGNA